jgi:hypothetical protein
VEAAEPLVRVALTAAVVMAAAAAVPAGILAMAVGAVLLTGQPLLRQARVAAVAAALEGYSLAAVSPLEAMAAALVSLVKVQTALLLLETLVKLAARVRVAAVFYLVPAAVAHLVDQLGEQALSVSYGLELTVNSPQLILET